MSLINIFLVNWRGRKIDRVKYYPGQNRHSDIDKKSKPRMQVLFKLIFGHTLANKLKKPTNCITILGVNTFDTLGQISLEIVSKCRPTSLLIGSRTRTFISFNNHEIHSVTFVYKKSFVDKK